MGECGLDHFLGCARPFRGPVPEARPEPMQHGGDAESFDQVRQRHVGKRLPAGTAEQQARAVTAPPWVVQDLDRPPGERHAVIPFRLHARRGWSIRPLHTEEPGSVPSRHDKVRWSLEPSEIEWNPVLDLAQ